MKNVSLGYFRSERKPFHRQCWRRYHSIKIKKDIIAYVALVIVAFMIFGVWLFLLTGLMGIIAFILCVVVLIMLGVAYYRIEE